MFSRDGEWICFLNADQDTLWVSLPDGRDKRQINLPRYPYELPQWSPDGKTIALMAKIPDHSWRILTVHANGGPAGEASKGDDPQGAPTWSPDSQWISYGNVECEATRTCAIHRLSVVTGEELVLPGSEGLSTARWPPEANSLQLSTSRSSSGIDLRPELVEMI